MKKFVLAVASMLALCFLMGCGGETEIDVNQYVKVEFSGYDTIGEIAEYEFDVKQMKKDHDALEDVSKKDIEKIFEEAFSFDKTSGLTNGDQVAVTWDVDEDDIEDFAEEYKVQLLYSDFTIEVSELEKAETFDPFEGVVVEYSGTAPFVTAYVYDQRDYDAIGRYEFEYSLDKSDHLSNGDEITLTVESYYGEEFDKYCIENYGKIPEATTKKITVKGCKQYVTKVEDIPAADKDKLDEYMQNNLKKVAEGWSYPDSLCEITFMGNVFAEKLHDTYYSPYVDNALYFIYKVDVDSVVDGAFAYYYYGLVTGLSLNESGDLVYSEYNISFPTMYNGWYTSGTYFQKGALYYEGYETYDALYNDVLQPLSENYDTVDNSVDEGIIEKETHVPNDYSTITDVLNLSADCFTYKWYMGSYHVSGLTQKGYDEIIKYNVADYVSIQLPSATEDGTVVEGFYSSGEEGGYSFGKLTCEEAPRFELVCADTYTSLYGFCADSFDSDYIFKLKNIKLNDGLKDIKAYAFRNCQYLDKIVIPGTVEIIPEYAFQNCYYLKEVTIPSSVTEIQKYAFENCNALVLDSLTLGSTKIGYNAFAGVTINKLILDNDNYVPQRMEDWGYIYSSLKDVKANELIITEMVTQIPDYAFEGLKGIKEVTIPEKVKKIGASAFSGCVDLTKIVLTDGLEEIGYTAFADCTALKTANIPSSVTSIGTCAFFGCNLLSIDLLELASMKVGYCAFEEVTIREIIMSSDDCALECYYDWGDYYPAFYYTIVKKVTITEGVTTLPDYAFAYLQGTVEVEIPASVTTIGDNAFAKGIDTDITIVTPAGSAAETYANNNGIRVKNQ